MKRIFLLSFVAFATLFASCQKEEDLGRVLTATIEQYEHNSKDGNGASKAYINDQYYACWENNDKVKINGNEYTVSIDDDLQNATINLGEVPPSGNLLAFYPASQVTSWSGNTVTISLPPVQEYRENNGHQVINNPMAAYCPQGSDELKFRNLCALLEVTIQAPDNEALAIQKILVKGDEDQMLWGTTKLTLDHQNKPILEKMSNGSATASLCFESPMQIDEGESKKFYIVVPAGSDFIDFTIHVVTDQKKAYRRVSKLGQGLLRNQIGALGYAPTSDDVVNPSTIIFYEGSVAGFKTDAFGMVAVISSDAGIIFFDRSLTTIGEDAFNYCQGLTSITLPDEVTSIGEKAFYGCNSLTCVTSPRKLTTIEKNAFAYCRRLSNIDLHDSLKTIGAYAFECCNFTNISLPASLTSIDVGAFRDCANLNTVYVNRWDGNSENITQGNSNMFSGCPLTSGIYVPTGAVEAYKSADHWREYDSAIRRMLE